MNTFALSSWSHFLNKAAVNSFDQGETQTDHVIVGLGLSLTGFMLVTFVCALLIIVMTPIALDFVRRLRGDHHHSWTSPLRLKD